MKLIITTLLLLAANVSAFTSVAPKSLTSTASSDTALNLFGGKKDGEKKGPGMMDQIAMLKKAQEVASKKMALDKELAKEEHVGVSSNEKVRATIKYVPPLPMQQPGYDGTKFDIDEEYLAGASAEELSAMASEALQDGYKKATVATAEKMQSLSAELGGLLSDMPKQ
eukprot:CAMPEP_0172481922 /NCGR_PEP_ID=MMETSP1066-20121228/8112_1 /TAXON_ID=671091 /ORGANISM="Coscinodiscus wailesii, Strain CCMP2513" /LENGTH=167 /DNA_ID=CAMNT_0013244653 /DNA_START=77 /DNA_END=580 /DNA_ORIENTATION=-